MSHQFFRTTFQMAACALCFALALGGRVDAQTLFYVDIFSPDASYGSINRIGADASGQQLLHDTGGGLRAIAIDEVAGKIYWVDADNAAIRRCNLDGSDPQDVIVGPPVVFPSAIAVDHAGGKIYWGDQVANQLWRANLDGSNPQLLRSTAFHRGIALDTVNGKVYWSTSETFEKGDILRCNLDGTNPQVVIHSNDAQFKPSAIALDVAGGKIYWTDYVVDIVRRANLDGTEMITLFFVGANLNPRGIALDLEAGKVYWGQDIDFESPIGQIKRMDLDGAQPQDVHTAGLINYLVVLPDGQQCLADIAPSGGDGSVNVEDLLAVIGLWGPCADPNNCVADIAPIGGNDVVNVQDLLAVISAWGACQ